MVEVKTIRILYMEDDPGLSTLLRKNLQLRGYTVEVAANGEEGLALLEKEQFNILLLDYNMPFCGGIDVIRTLASRGPLPPTIMVTGEGNEEIAVEALKLGAADYIVKDVELKYLELLPTVIEKVLYNQQMAEDRQRMEAAVRESEERYRRLVEMSPDGIAVVVDGKYAFVNPAGVRLLSAARPEQLIGKRALDVVHPDFHAIVRDRTRQLEAGSDSVPWIEEKYVRVDGKVIDVEVAGTPFAYGGESGVQIIFRDITDRKQVAQRLEHLALYDTLTDLPNRTLFFDRLSQLLALAKRNSYILAVLFIDLDRFKAINDNLGHDVGDYVLKEAAARMLNCTRRADTVARMGGDEFIGICGRITAAGDAAVVAKKIIDTLTAPYRFNGKDCTIGASVGISVYPMDGDDADTLLKKADLAMYRVKEQGKGGFAFYTEALAKGEKS